MRAGTSLSSGTLKIMIPAMASKPRHPEEVEIKIWTTHSGEGKVNVKSRPVKTAAENLAPREGLEPPTYWLTANRSAD
jgi:hypothetical protein